MEPTTLISLSGSLMGLFGLLVSLFSIHLGNWLSKLQGLRTKWDINNGSDDKEIAARRECRYTMAEVYNWQPFVMTVIILAFGAAVLYFFNDVRHANTVVFPSIFVYLYNGFFGIMFVLQAFLLLNGWSVGQGLKNDIDTQFPKPKR
ncbi:MULTISPECIES: hypothetical protein [unclassified Rhizobium]|jgi:hypothetical protein|uniref:hypothetical protein n=1 Tax=unclassified Rhizobium TaxID=2613769 RepID=UPI0006464E25|nr:MULTISPECIES: hypothetical protein [unclassified Rhizobium]OJY72102.1 MAG: hypothetical protein BGP09_25530 [Rhizobium sp. 60-20]RKD36046.1 hypothetical protein BJ928_12524 [Rhizobium sp. WW_1]